MKRIYSTRIRTVLALVLAMATITHSAVASDLYFEGTADNGSHCSISLTNFYAASNWEDVRELWIRFGNPRVSASFGSKQVKTTVYLKRGNGSIEEPYFLLGDKLNGDLVTLYYSSRTGHAVVEFTKNSTGKIRICEADLTVGMP